MQTLANGFSSTSELNISLDADPSEPVWLHPHNLRLLEKARINCVVSYLGKKVLGLGLDGVEISRRCFCFV